jgi:ectoine hydroxylase-related dioxygenase (phytanoyl-CoA dioxygenase family)
MKVETYGRLKLYFPLFKSEFQSEILITLVSMVYLSKDYNKFDDFYKNKYLLDIIKIEKLPEKNKIIKALSIVGEFEYDLTTRLINEINSIIIQTVNDNKLEINEITHTKLLKGQNLICIYLEKLIEIESSFLNKNKYNLFKHDNNLIKEINENGYAIIENFLSSDALIEMKSALNSIAERERKNGVAYMYGSEQRNQRVYNLLSKHKCFREILECNFLENLMDNLFYRPTYHDKFGLSSIAAHIIPHNGEAMLMHVDNAVPDPMPPWRIRFIVVICLTDMSIDNGAPAVVPRSHKLLKKPSYDEAVAAVADEKVLVAPAGSLVMWDGALWHRSRKNITNFDRVGVIISYAASFFKEICGEEEHLLVVPSTLQEELSPRLRSLIGLDRGIKTGAMFFGEKKYE